MSQHRRLLVKFQRQQLTRSLVLCLIACIFTAAVFSPVGLVTRWTGIDLSFLLLPILGYCIIRLLSRPIAVTFFPVASEVLACVLNGAALALAGYLFFSQADLLTRIPWLSGSRALLDNLIRIPGYWVVIVTGYTLLEANVPVRFLLHTRAVAPLFSAAGYVLIGTGLWRNLAVFSSSWPAADGIGLVIFCTLLVLAATRLGWYGLAAANPLLADTARWLTAKPWEKILAGGLIAAYVIFIREALFDHISTAYLIEWLIFCVLSWRIFESIREGLEKRYVVSLKDSGWQKHVQRVEDLIDENFNKLVILQEDFVAGGSRQEILNYIRQLLVQNGQSEEEVVRSLRPIIEHNDRKVPWYAFDFWQRRIIKLNRLNRRKSLDDTINKLAEIGTPGLRY
jgi:hypothetical protein